MFLLISNHKLVGSRNVCEHKYIYIYNIICIQCSYCDAVARVEIFMPADSTRNHLLSSDHSSPFHYQIL